MGVTHSESESDALIPELQSAYCNIRFVFCGHTPHVLQWPFCEGFESLKEGASILTDHKPDRAELQIIGCDYFWRSAIWPREQTSRMELKTRS